VDNSPGVRSATTWSLGRFAFVDPDHGPDKYEAKVLLGDTVARDWHYGVNFIYEQEVADARETDGVLYQSGVRREPASMRAE